jgi:hypothetical protein
MSTITFAEALQTSPALNAFAAQSSGTVLLAGTRFGALGVLNNCEQVRERKRPGQS